MSTCARCGRKDAPGSNENCSSCNSNVIACRDREIANLRSLIRSVTRRLENAREMLSDNRPITKAVAVEIDAVLEAIS